MSLDEELLRQTVAYSIDCAVRILLKKNSVHIISY